MLTAAIRDLHIAYPNSFRTGVFTNYQDLFQGNPYISPLSEKDDNTIVIDCHYPVIHKSNDVPFHFIHGFMQYFNVQLALKVVPTAFKGDIYLTPEEINQTSPLLSGFQNPYWLLSAGGKTDYTIKWWDSKRYQLVVKELRDEVTFVQVGAVGDFHPELEGVIDLRGKTTLRDLIQLVYHSCGVLCGVTMLMHLSAAVPLKPGEFLRPCVVIAGGREPVHWEAYPGHDFLNSIGLLPCCATGGCWRSRTAQLDDDHPHDRPEHLCVDVVGNLPRCMDLITVEEVCQTIRKRLNARKELLEIQKANAGFSEVPYVKSSQLQSKRSQTLSELTAQTFINSALNRFEEFPHEDFAGRGIIICGGGIKYFPSAWICIKLLRKLGCSLPIELWHLGEDEIDDHLSRILLPFGVKTVDALAINAKYRSRILNGWELKPFSIIHSSFEEVLLLDADNCPLINPEYLFEQRPYIDTGAVFWPDLGRLGPSRSIWQVCDVSYVDEPEFESGQILINKRRCWKALQLTMWFNEHSDFFYKHMHGDKETFHMAFRRTNTPFAMPLTTVTQLNGTLCQHDFEGRRIFQHRNGPKWRLIGQNVSIPGFELENECFQFLDELRLIWSERYRARTGEPLVTETAIERLPPLHKRALILKAPFDTFTGYGVHSQRVADHLLRKFNNVGLKPLNSGAFHDPALPQAIRDAFGTAFSGDRWELLLTPPHVTPSTHCASFYFTMWETTRLPPHAVNLLNKADEVIVPSEFNADCFSAQGVTRPISLIPLGIDPDVFYFEELPPAEPFIFGTAGNLAISGRSRKGIEEVIAAFKNAFPSDETVRLEIKCMPGDNPPVFKDSRIRLVEKLFTESELAAWFRKLHCFVSGSKCEAWGFMPHQALAVGRPVIIAPFGGVREFVSRDNSFLVEFTLAPATERYEGLGKWAQPSIEAMADQMKIAESDWEQLRAKSIRAQQDARQYTWKHANQRLSDLLVRRGVNI